MQFRKFTTYSYIVFIYDVFRVVFDIFFSNLNRLRKPLFLNRTLSAPDVTKRVITVGIIVHKV